MRILQNVAYLEDMDGTRIGLRLMTWKSFCFYLQESMEIKVGDGSQQTLMPTMVSAIILMGVVVVGGMEMRGMEMATAAEYPHLLV